MIDSSVIVWIAVLPEVSWSQNAVRFVPKGVTIPMPVTTTRRPNVCWGGYSSVEIVPWVEKYRFDGKLMLSNDTKGCDCARLAVCLIVSVDDVEITPLYMWFRRGFVGASIGVWWWQYLTQMRYTIRELWVSFTGGLGLDVNDLIQGKCFGQKGLPIRSNWLLVVYSADVSNSFSILNVMWFFQTLALVSH